MASLLDGDSLARPAFAIPAVLRRLAVVWQARRQRCIDRAAFRTMLQLDDHLLDDVGVRRSEVEWAAGLPLDVSAAQALRAAARARRHG